MELFFKNKVWEFKPVHNYPGYYVNEYGVIYSETRKCFCNPINFDYYLKIRLSKNKKKHYVLISRIVCRAWNGPPPPNHKIVNHKDMNTLNNHYTNVEWSTHAKNQQHKHANGGGLSPEEKRLRYGVFRSMSSHLQIP